MDINKVLNLIGKVIDCLVIIIVSAGVVLSIWYGLTSPGCNIKSNHHELLMEQ